MTDQNIRYALVERAPSVEALKRYLPDNYNVIATRREPGGTVYIISGTDEAGWTLDDYVIPRLASGLIWATEIDHAGDVR